ncbi:BMP family lipoprotein [Leeia aquatica]|uniref:BMP family ABC transporter substrate-binding protein n=1 Tax=Leeia aquatica TaxID=2725557 RepID=A0A847S8B8_9NEIS|nr:BMP family ABC transporter substrate-binding protein [Leeia aquatica]NLR76204.1 BMP family ABC transporter substrate-binding protein [Leeia aquatica]
MHGLLRAPALASLALMASTVAHALTPAIIYDQGGKFDKGFNESAFVGAEKFRAESKISFLEAMATHENNAENQIRNMIQKGADHIILIGFTFSDAVAKTSKEFPKVRFTLVDSVVEGPNVQSIVFKEHEGSYLVGMAAAYGSKTSKLGFITAMDIPMLQAFGCGYAQGAKQVRGNIEVFTSTIGTTGEAFSNPPKAALLAKKQIEKGADVVYAAAGASGLGTLRVARDTNTFAIGVDSNQNWMLPGRVLTSMVKRIDTAVYQALTSSSKGSWKPGILKLGLKEGGVDWSLDTYNASLISPATKAAVEQARKNIIEGKTRVVDFREGNSCPVALTPM